eukprot:m.30234 g.30234  ORF g.30234 m.30234 type:complete len:167 (+) comp13843_c0_seq3:1255-1755(+)
MIHCSASEISINPKNVVLSVFVPEGNFNEQCLPLKSHGELHVGDCRGVTVHACVACQSRPQHSRASSKASCQSGGHCNSNASTFTSGGRITPQLVTLLVVVELEFFHAVLQRRITPPQSCPRKEGGCAGHPHGYLLCKRSVHSCWCVFSSQGTSVASRTYPDVAMQ